MTFTDNQKDLIKEKMRDAMITTMDFGTESEEATNKLMEFAGLLSGFIGRALTAEEVDSVRTWFEAMGREVLTPSNLEDKNKRYELLFGVLGGCING